MNPGRPSPHPSGPAGPRPGGPVGPQPSGPPYPGPPSPGPSTDFDYIDDALIGLIAVAAFGPCERGTARSVRQVCAAAVLLHRLRMARKAVAELRAAFESPARQDFDSEVPASVAVATPGGPGMSHPLHPGEGATPAQAAGAGTPARISRRADTTPAAGANVLEFAVGTAPIAGRSFYLP